MLVYSRKDRDKCHPNLRSDGKKTEGRSEENNKDTDKKRKTGILIASGGRACV